MTHLSYRTISSMFVCLLAISSIYPQCRSITEEGPIPFGGGSAITEDFNILGPADTDNILPTGWLISESGTNANTKYLAGDGNDASGDTYSFGATNSTNRTFGGLRTEGFATIIGVCFSNDIPTSIPLRYFSVSYKGKKWRAGETAGGDKLLFQYSLDATSLTSGNWINYTPLDYTSPSSSAAGAIDGNSVFTTRQSFFGPSYMPPNGTIYFRWVDFDVAGNDDGLGIDDFYLAPYRTLGAYVDVGGQVTNALGFPLSGIKIVLSNSDGTVYDTTTDSGGFYNFPAVSEAGTTIVLSAPPQFGMTFAQSPRLINVLDPITDANFVRAS